jgi:3',5'-cyclic-AMP phosphodiesterase
MNEPSDQLLWLTDIHLTFLSRTEINAFIEHVKMANPGGLLVGGDIGEADSIVEYLELLAISIACPIYFVLGNHDYYGGNIENVRKRVMASANKNAMLHWLPNCEPIRLSAKIGLIGHGGWGDGTVGSFKDSKVLLNDFERIGDFIGISHNKTLLQGRLKSLGEDAAKILKTQLKRAFLNFSSVVILTHVPPFQEATWHNGTLSDGDWLPFFTCGAVGSMLKNAALENPNRKIVVFCGHTHSQGNCEILPNLIVHTGGARYGKPGIQRVLNF